MDVATLAIRLEEHGSVDTCGSRRQSVIHASCCLLFIQVERAVMLVWICLFPRAYLQTLIYYDLIVVH
jgi:hypothetical protein